ncbi:hypothetical protein L6452_02742 [Arctium lappa]|uniref:Uncharacterized protein n=1 Tax=Arctium lappa TaxID=4217 RepID=A0ACB9FKF9_ARCLA|nr:hypothetical protein L6452_02742 [Arctium lappa]
MDQKTLTITDSNVDECFTFDSSMVHTVNVTESSGVRSEEGGFDGFDDSLHPFIEDGNSQRPEASLERSRNEEKSKALKSILKSKKAVGLNRIEEIDQFAK